MSEFVSCFPIPWRDFSHHVKIFPTPTLFSLLTEEIPAYLMQKNAVGGSKYIPLTAEGIIRRI
jgi:hypothetical protein